MDISKLTSVMVCCASHRDLWKGHHLGVRTAPDTLSLVSRVSLQTLEGAQAPHVFHLPWLPFPGEETLNAFLSCETTTLLRGRNSRFLGGSSGCLHWRAWGFRRTGCVALALRLLQRPVKGRSREGRLREVLGCVASLGPLWHCCGVAEPAQMSDS